MPYTKEQILETFKKLPEDVREAMFSVDTAMVFQDIRQKYKLTIDKMGELADETGLVMLGFTHPKDYISHLTERLAVSREIAKEIAEEINSRVFYSVREQLKKIHGLKQETPTKDGPLQDFQRPTLDLLRRPPEAESELPGRAGRPKAPISSTLNVEHPNNIFEARTKEEIFRAPKTISEKTPTSARGGVGAPTESVGVDPYREQI